MTGITKNRREVLLYLLFGVLTTLVNLASFHLMGRLIGEERYLISNAAAWLISVIFAYVTNKIFVFSSKVYTPIGILRECAEFFGARAASLAIEELGLFLLIDVCHMGDFSLGVISGQLIAKIILAFIVVALNYVFSKFIIFKRRDTES